MGRSLPPGRRRRLDQCVPALAAALALVTCASARDLTPAEPAPAEQIETALFLVGDAGKPLGDDPVLGALRDAVAEKPQRSLAVFLGDNVYPRGLPAEGARGRLTAERRLSAQVDAVVHAGARAVFIPGNHDWDKQGRDGWEAVQRQERFLEARGADHTPDGGCPGPVTRDVGARLRLVVLDTQWWLHRWAKPGPGSDCDAATENDVEAALYRAVSAPSGRHVVVVGHHPLASGGAHGGAFGWRSHLFPLREVRRWLWLPLPGLGSLYPLSRRNGVTDQDLSGAANRRMRRALERVFAWKPPLVYAAGHEHGLQVLEGESARHVLVSGSGSSGHQSPVRRIGATRFARAAPGFMRLDLLRDGRARLAVIVVSREGSAVEAYSAWLD